MQQGERQSILDVGRRGGACALVAALCLVATTIVGVRSGSAGASSLRYTGPLVLRAGSVLTAQTPVDPHIAAVTFMVDGRPLATDAVIPFTAELLRDELTEGRHVVRVQLVYRSGNRRLSARVPVMVVRRGGSRPLVVSSSAQLRHVLPRLARGNVAVQLGPGQYEVNELQLGAHVLLRGSGADTVLVTPAGAYAAGLVVNGTDVTVAHLTIDGSGPGAGEGNAVTVQPGATHVVLRGLTIKRARTVGVYGWGRIADISVQDSTISGGGTADAGVTFRMAEANDVSVVRTAVTGMRGWGILFSQVPHDNHTAGLRAVALDNVISDIDETKYTNGTSKGGIWSGGAQAIIVGNRIRRIGWDGIETVGSSDGVWIAANSVSETKTGIYLEHKTTNSVVRNNTITNVDTGIIVEWLYDGIGSTDNRFIGNKIVHAGTGIFVDYGSDRNVLQHNIFSYGSRPTIILQGASNNLVLDNQACGAAGAVVSERYADPGTGTAVLGQGNVIQRNSSLPTCDG